MGLDKERNNFLDYAFKNHYDIDRVNKTLKHFGYRPLGPVEEGFYRSGKWGTNVFERMSDDAKEIGQGLSTAWMMALNAKDELLADPEGKTKQWANNVGNYLGEKGLGGLAGDVYDIMTSPYGITRKDIAEKGVAGALYQLPGSALSHPVYTTLDAVLPAMGKVPTHQVGNLLAKSKVVPQVVKDFIPSTEISKANKALNSAVSITGVDDRAMAELVRKATKGQKGDLTQAVKNLEIPQGGKWVGDEATIALTKALAEVSDVYGQKLLKLGVKADEAKKTAVAQYIFETINPDRSKPITLDVIRNAMDKQPGAAKALGLQTAYLDSLASEGSKLFDAGVIKPLSHRSTFSKSSMLPDLVTAEDKALGELATRHYGWATPEELGPTLFKSYEQVAKDIRDAETGKLAVKHYAEDVGQKVSLNDLKKMFDNNTFDKDSVVFSPRAFEDMISKDFSKMKWSTVSNRLDALAEKGLNIKAWGNYGDDLYIIKKANLKPLKNFASTKKSKVNDILGKVLGKFNPYWKTAQLTTPKYWTENRVGNIFLNWTEGVTLKDYLDASRWGRYGSLRPERLKHDTSYAGVLGEEFKGTPGGQAFKQGVGKITQSVKDRSPRDFFGGIYDTFTGTVLGFESQFEALDRYANFIRQVKRLSKKTGRSVEDILKEANSSRRTYDEILEYVNKSLGDYIGRNWAINPDLYSALSFAYPFFKYPTQGLRTLTHQAMNRPLNFATKVTLPQRIGLKKWEEQKKKYPEIADEKGGLVVGSIPGKGGYTILRNWDVHPLGAGASLLSNALYNWKEIGGSPLFDVARLLMYKDRYGNTASSPRYFNSPGGGPTFFRGPDGRPTMRVMERPSLGDYLSYVGAEGSNLFRPEVKAVNSWVGPLIAGTSGIIGDNLYWYPRYGTSMMGQIGDRYMPKYVQPFISGKTDYAGMTGKEARGYIMGVRNLKVYPKQSEASIGKHYKSAIKKYERNQNTKRYLEDLIRRKKK